MKILKHGESSKNVEKNENVENDEMSGKRMEVIKSNDKNEKRS